jgi:hypothetical protein
MDQNRRADRIPFVIDGELPATDHKLTLRHGRHPTDTLRTIAILLCAPHALVIASATLRSSQKRPPVVGLPAGGDHLSTGRLAQHARSL